MPRPKCTECSKKINKLFIQQATCKCENIYCYKHLGLHDCSFDFKEHFKKNASNEKIVAAKVVKI